MRWLLDTNVCVDAMRGRREVIDKLAAKSPDDCAISTVSMFELEAGARKSRRPDRELQKVRLFADTLVVVPWDAAAASEAARIRFELEAAGTKTGPYDVQLAGHAKALGLVLVTDNTGEFSRVAALRLENWRD